MQVGCQHCEVQVSGFHQYPTVIPFLLVVPFLNTQLQASDQVDTKTVSLHHLT